MAAETARGRPRRSLPLFLVLLAGAFVVSLAPRAAHYVQWRAAPERHFAGDVPVAGADSYYYFRLARESLAGVERGSVDPLRDFPDGRAWEGLPALSWAIARLANALGVDVYRAGMLLAIVSSSLFVFPLGAFCWRAGVPVAAVLGGLFGSFGFEYYARTTLERVDTDGGNQFFVWAIAACMAQLSRQAAFARAAAWAAVSGLAVTGFVAWYGQPFFFWLYAAAFAVCARACGQRGRAFAGLFAIFLVAANPGNAVAGVGNLVRVAGIVLGTGTEAPAASAIEFPSASGGALELQRLPPLELLWHVLDWTWLAAAGLVLFGAFCVRAWPTSAALLPIVLLGGLAFGAGRRFAMYLGPPIGIGWGFAVARVADRLVGPTRPRVAELAAYAAAAAGFAAVAGATAFGESPRLRIPVHEIASLQRLAEALPPGAALYHTWSYGYLIADVTGHPTFNDGGAPDSAVEQLMSRGVTGSDPAELARITRFLAARGRAGVQELLARVSSYPELLAEIRRAEVRPERPVVLVFTERMIREYRTNHRHGQWDFAAGEGPFASYGDGRCRAAGGGVLRCTSRQGRHFMLDLQKGTLEGAPRVLRTLHVARQGVRDEIRYDHGGDTIVQVLAPEAAGEVAVLLLHEATFRSNFNQMFLLGRVDERYFRMIHDDFPHLRAFELRALPGAQPPETASTTVSSAAGGVASSRSSR